MKTVEVVAAIIIKNNQILCMQRAENKKSYLSKKYEFPGGKVEKGEALSEALRREINEEMEVDLPFSEDDYFMTVDHQYPDFRLIMHSYLHRVEELPFTMTEHINAVWVNRDNIELLDWAEADIPIVKKLLVEENIWNS